MGNRQKSQRQKFYSQKQKSLLSVVSQAANSTKVNQEQKPQAIIEANKPCKNESILGIDWVEESFFKVREEIVDRIKNGSIQIKPRNYTYQASGKYESIIIDQGEVSQFQNLVSNHLDLYEKHISKMVASYNQEMKMEQITKKNWDDFCIQLEKSSFFHHLRKTNKSTFENKSSNDILTSFGGSLSLDSQIPRLIRANPESSGDQEIRQEIKKFRQFLMTSQESFVLFSRVAQEFQRGFFQIYGQGEEEMIQEWIVDPWKMEKLIEIDLFYLISLYDFIVEKMMQKFCSQGQMTASQNDQFIYSLEGEGKTLPVINMLFLIMRPVFDRIRFILQSTEKLFFKKYLVAPRKINEIIPKESLQLRNVKVPYNESIISFKNLSIAFKKNPLSAIKLIKTVLKPTIFKEINNSLDLSFEKANSASFQFPETVPSYGASVKVQDEFLLQFNEGQDQQIPVKAKENYSNSCYQIRQVDGFGAEELLPVYAFVIIQGEKQMEDTLFFDLKIFNMVFAEIQDRVPSFSEHLLNATNLLQSYINICTSNIPKKAQFQ